MKWAKPEEWDNFIKSENTRRDEALTAFAIRVAKDRDPIASLWADVEQIHDLEANEQFEIVRFNYEFLPQKRMNVEINAAKSALAALERGDKKYAAHERRQEKFEIDWRKNCGEAELLRIQIDMTLKPQRPAFAPTIHSTRTEKITLNFGEIDPDFFGERRHHFWRCIESLREQVNGHMRKHGNISLIRTMEELRRIMLHLEEIFPKRQRATKYLDELRCQQQECEEKLTALKRTLCGMGDFALYALMCLYIKLSAA